MHPAFVRSLITGAALSLMGSAAFAQAIDLSSGSAVVPAGVYGIDVVVTSGSGGGGYTGVVGAGGTAGRENANPFTSGGGGGGGGSCAYAGDAANSFVTPPTAAAGPAGGAGGLSSQNTGSFASPGSAGTVTAVVNPAVVAPPVAAVPTMETWGLLAMGALLAGFGVRRVRKQG